MCGQSFLLTYPHGTICPPIDFEGQVVVAIFTLLEMLDHIESEIAFS
jgi:hypothetical protein